MRNLAGEWKVCRSRMPPGKRFAIFPEPTGCFCPAAALSVPAGPCGIPSIARVEASFSGSALEDAGQAAEDAEAA
jgi:hypothetical protein